MGFTNVKVRISNPADLTKLREIELLVDSGALFTAIPRALLEELGLKPIARRRLKFFGGAIVERDMGLIVMEYDEARAGVPVIFGEEEDLPILGSQL